MSNATNLQALQHDSSEPSRATPILLVLGLCLAATICPARAVDANTVLAAWFAQQTNLHTWSAGFTQTRAFRTLSKPLVVQGKVWVALPDQFRWELGEPPQTIALRQSDTLVVIYPRLKRAERYPLTGGLNQPWRNALALFEAGFPRTRADLESRFRLLSVTEKNATYRLTFAPRNASARRLLKAITITLDKNGFSMRASEVQFADGSALNNTFTNAVVNASFSRDLFHPQLGADITVVGPPQK